MTDRPQAQAVAAFIRARAAESERGTACDPGAAPTEVHGPDGILAATAMRQLVDDLMAERHLVVDGDCWYACSAATEERDGGTTCDDARVGGPCDCGLDERRLRRLLLLAVSFTGHRDYPGLGAV